jgi:hypothetical protein
MPALKVRRKEFLLKFEANATVKLQRPGGIHAV